MVEDEWRFNLIVMCFCLHAKCLALCLASDYGSIFCFYLNYIYNNFIFKSEMLYL